MTPATNTSNNPPIFQFIQDNSAVICAVGVVALGLFRLLSAQQTRPPLRLDQCLLQRELEELSPTPSSGTETNNNPLRPISPQRPTSPLTLPSPARQDFPPIQSKHQIDWGTSDDNKPRKTRKIK